MNHNALLPRSLYGAENHNKTKNWDCCHQRTFVPSCVCSKACGVIRPAGDKELATSSCKWSGLSNFAAPPRTTVLLSSGFRALAATSGTGAFTGWNVLTRLSTGYAGWPVSGGAGGAMFSVRLRTVLGLSGWSFTRVWVTEDEDIWRKRGLPCNALASASSLCRIWPRSISSKVEAFWWPAISWIPVAAGLTKPEQSQYFYIYCEM